MELVGNLSSTCRYSSTSATEEAIAAAESIFSLELPEQLRGFLLECDGISDEYGAEIIWSVAEIVRQNRQFRSNGEFQTLYMPFDTLLLIGADGGGDLFAFPIQADGMIHRLDLFRWNHETDAREWYAGRLERYLEQRLRDEFAEKQEEQRPSTLDASDC
jgi:hypothetical protein